MKRIITTLTIILTFLPFLNAAVDSTFYDIKISIKGFNSKKAYLGYYYGNETYIVDSSKVDSLTGFMRFTRNRRIPEGVYFISNTEGVQLFDFIVNGWKDFTIKTQLESPIENAEVIRSEENHHYFDYLKTVNKLKKSLTEHESAVMLKKTISDDELKNYYRILRGLEYQQGVVINNNPQLFIAKLIHAQSTFDAKKYLKTINKSSFLIKSNEPERSSSLNYPLHLFWENFDFRDIRLLYSRVYEVKFKEYVSLVSSASLDLQKKYCDILLGNSKVSLEYYQLTLKWLTKHFETNLDSKEASILLEYLVKNYHHRTGSGTQKHVLEHLDKTVSELKIGSNRSN